MPSLPTPDLAGRTDIGKVRSENQDHFLACALDTSVRVRVTSIAEGDGPDWSRLCQDVEAPEGGVVLAAVADGVGGGPAGELASRRTLVLLAGQLAGALRDETDPQETRSRLASAVLRVHRRILETAADDPGAAGMATTLTAWAGTGNQAYVMNVGDSRCYRLRDGGLQLLTRDQTMAQDLVDQGLIDDLSQAPLGWDNILTGAVGGSAAEPAITITDRRPGDVVLVCSDGVMKHVSDRELMEILARDSDSAAMAAEIVRRALEDGGTDNVTCVVMREPA